MKLLLLLYFPLLLFYSYAAASTFSAILKPRHQIRYPWITCFLYCVIFLIPASIIKNQNSVLGTMLLYLIVFSPMLLFFQRNIRQKVICFIFLSFTIFMIEIISISFLMFIFYLKTGCLQFTALTQTDNVWDLFLLPLPESIIGIIFYSRVIPRVKNFLGYCKARTCLLLGLPTLIPTIAQGLIIYKYQSPYFPFWAAMYWLICTFTYPLFFIGIKDLQKQEKKHLQLNQQLQLVKKQIDFSKEMEIQYQTMRKWNHDIENHLVAISYLLD